MATWAIKKVDIANFAKLPSQSLEFGGRLFAVEFLPTRDETLQRFSQRRVILCPRVVEHGDDFLSSESLDFLRPNERRITSVIADLLREPLELLVLHGLIRQQIRRCF